MAAGPSNQLKRKDLSLGEKILVIEDVDRKISQTAVAEKFGISQSQVSRILKSKTKLLSAYRSNKNPFRKRSRKSNQENIENALLHWFKQVQSRGVEIDGPMLREKAKNLGKHMGIDFNPSVSWVTRWRERNFISFTSKHRRKLNCNSAADKHWLNSVWPKIQERFAASEIYNCDETGLYFRFLPEGTWYFKNEDLAKHEKCKDHLTVLLAANMDGSDKLEPFVVGKFANPRCFNGIKKLPVTYRCNSNSWMTAKLFQDWLRSFDSSLEKQNKKICLLLDNCSAHKIDENELKYIELVYFPPNITSSNQPLDQGIIKNFKHNYRHRVLQKILISIDADENVTAAEVSRSISLLDAVHYVNSSWNFVSADTIQSGFCRSLTPADFHEPFLGFPTDEIPLGFTKETYSQYVNVDEHVEVACVQDDADICEEILQSKQQQQKDDDINREDVADTITLTPPMNKEVLDALDVIRRRLQYQGANMDTFFQLEKEVLFF